PRPPRRRSRARPPRASTGGRAAGRAGPGGEGGMRSRCRLVRNGRSVREGLGCGASMSDAPRISAHTIPAPEATERMRAQATASYEARPEEVNRVLLLYSGGLDTSVMLKWIQDEYEAEVVTLTVNLGQPGEDYGVVEGKARQLGAVETFVVDAREEFARDFVVPAIKANAVYGLGYPLFTALGRPLIAKLAVEYARRAGCDTIAHGCT